MHEIAAIALCIISYTLGREFRKIREELGSIKDSLLEKPSSPSVVSPDSEVSRANRKESSFIAEPKSPQQIEFEETEALRKMNPGKF